MEDGLQAQEMVVYPNIIPSYPRAPVLTIELQDPYIYVWDFDQEDLSSPIWKFHGPTVSIQSHEHGCLRTS